MNSKYLSILVILVIMIVLLIIIFASDNDGDESANVNTFVEITERLKLVCETDTDCKNYVSYNSCEAICANTQDINALYIKNFELSCDASNWDPEFISCECVENTCQEALQIIN